MNPGVIYWSEVLRQTLQKRKADGRNLIDANEELSEAIAETNERILHDEKQT